MKYFFKITCLILLSFIFISNTFAATDPRSMSPEEFKTWLEKNVKKPAIKPSSPPPAPPSAGATPPPPLSAPLPPPPVAAKKENIPLPPLTVPEQPKPIRTRHGVMTYEEGQQSMVDTIAEISKPPSEDASIAFDALLQRNMPLAPTQVVKLRQQIDLAQRAQAVPANIPPKPVSTTLMINLAPGGTPPVIRLAQGYVSSLVFVDSTGAPWPIAAFDLGDPKSVRPQWDGKSNVLLMQGVSPYSGSNMVIRLVGLVTPITLELVSGQRLVDYRVDIHVSGIGPNTKELPLGTDLPSSANELLLGILDGVGPAGSKLLNVKGADAEAWALGEKIYLRTRLTVLSPGWVGTMVSPDGMHAYELPKTSTILVSRYGEPAMLKVEGF